MKKVIISFLLLTGLFLGSKNIHLINESNQKIAFEEKDISILSIRETALEEKDISILSIRETALEEKDISILSIKFDETL